MGADGYPICAECWKRAGTPIPEWRRRSMEGRGRFDAVTDTTGLVAL
jgi:hypothetical protein